MMKYIKALLSAEFASKYKLELIVFLCGFAVMVLELDGSRILAPYVGTSLFVWTSLIGIILGSLSLGYWYGGKLADKSPDYRILAFIILISSFYILALSILKEPLMKYFLNLFPLMPIRALFSTISFFAIPSILLGMVSPYALRLKLSDLKKSGKTSGNLYAISTIGSIAGTFAAGFFLIPAIGNTKILILISLILLFASILCGFKEFFRLKSFLVLFMILSLSLNYFVNKRDLEKGRIDVDSKYNRIIVGNSVDRETGKPIRALLTDPLSIQSAQFLDGSGELVFDYTKFFRTAAYFSPNLKNALMIGGGGYSYPKDFLSKNPQSNIDVIEIDPKFTELAKEHFDLKEHPRMKIFHEDGRTFLNNSNKKYDAIFVDAFKSTTAPFQLATDEAVLKMSRSLNDEGVVIVNVISSLSGKNSRFLWAEYATYQKNFSQVYLFPIFSNESNEVQNIMLVASKKDKALAFQDAGSEYKKFFEKKYNGPVQKGTILKDDFAPVENYLMWLF